eukprot:1159069-Pelagomonas_calceolata.AAC.4
MSSDMDVPSNLKVLWLHEKQVVSSPMQSCRGECARHKQLQHRITQVSMDQNFGDLMPHVRRSQSQQVQSLLSNGCFTA